MKTMLEYISKIQAIIQAVTGLSQVKVELTQRTEFGDLTTNIAMLQASNLKTDPWKLATGWSEKISKEKWIKSNKIKVEPVRPGFINFFLSGELLSKELIQATTNTRYGSQTIAKGKTAVVEYSSPNTNKPLHLGHLRNDALGMSLSHLMEFFGYEVIKTCVINDRGVHIMKSLYAYKEWGKGLTPEQAGKKGDHFVGDYYVMFNNQSKDKPELIDRAQELLLKWEAGDK